MNARGMTLVEAMATTVVLSFGMLGVSYLVMKSSASNRQSFSQQQA